MVRMAGKDPVPTCRVGFECGCRIVFSSSDPGFRTYLLLGDLSAGCFPGCYRAGRQEREEATLFLFAGTILVALRDTGRFYPGLGGGDRFPGRFARSLQRVWAYR